MLDEVVVVVGTLYPTAVGSRAPCTIDRVMMAFFFPPKLVV